MEIYKKILEFIFPSKCLSCQKITLPQGYFCAECFSKLKIGVSGGMCNICSTSLEYADELDICPKCAVSPPFFDRAIYIYEYNKISRKIVTNLKFFDKTNFAKYMADMIFRSFSHEVLDHDYIVFVPMHRKRMSVRFYNQAALIAKFLSKVSGVQIDYTNLSRVKFTKPQALLSKAERMENIKNAFRVRDSKLFVGKKLLIIDDVFTSGATLNECSRLLKKYGASRVTAITFAKTML